MRIVQEACQLLGAELREGRFNLRMPELTSFFVTNAQFSSCRGYPTVFVVPASSLIEPRSTQGQWVGLWSER